MKTKTGRRFLSTIIALVMLLSTGTICFSSLAAEGETVTDGDITYVISNGCITDVTVKDDAVLENYTVPAKVGKISINSIGDCAFWGTKITTLTIPETVTSIDGGAFNYCNLSKVIFNAPNCYMKESTLAYTNQDAYYLSANPAFFGNASLTEFEFGSKVGSIPAYVCTNVSSLETVKFNKTVSEIGRYTFYGCSALSNIDLSNLTEIGKAAFYGCNSLDIIDLPEAKNIGAEAFMSCGSPSKVSFPKAATIGACAFAQTGIDTVTIPETVTSIDGGAFNYCNLSKVIFNAPNCYMKESTLAYTNQDAYYLSANPAFFGNASLTEFDFGKNVEIIPAYACTNVYALKKVSFRAAVTEIGKNAFYGCPTPDEITYAGTEAQWNTLKENSEGTGNESLFKCTNIKYNSIPVTEYTVTFNANGGAVTPKAQKVAENTAITLPTTTRANYTFLGWSLDKNAATAMYPAGSTYKVTGNVTLYAVWKAIDKPVEKTFTDSASDVQVTDKNNAFDGKDVKINVEVTSSDAELDKKIHDFALTKASEIYNISFTYNGKEIQPNGMVKVRIPYDKEVKDSSKIKVFHYHKNSNGEMVYSKISNITIIPGYIEFETDSFSKFVVTEDITVTIEGNSKMQYKGTQTLKVDANGEVEFKSSNPKVVSVDKKTGKVTATGKGTATITSTIKGTDVSSSINITVSYTWWQWLIKIVLFGWIWY